MEDINGLIIDKHYSNGSSTRYYLGWLISNNILHYCLMTKNSGFTKVIFQGETKPRRFDLILEIIYDHPFYSTSEVKDKDYEHDRRHQSYPYEENIDQIYQVNSLNI